MHLQGALAIAGNVGAFAGRTKISFWMYVGVTGSNGASARVADITIGLWGPQVGVCSAIQTFVYLLTPSMLATCLPS
jgi:hypothetical protein